MQLQPCKGCERPVLELEGQYVVLDSVYLTEDFPAPDTWGCWHAQCFHAAGCGLAWYKARLRNFLDVRRYHPVADLAEWSVIRNPRTKETLAFGHKGELMNLTRLPGRPSRSVAGGAVHPVLEDEFNLELADAATISAIQQALASTGTYPLLQLIQALGIADQVIHPYALEHGVFRFERSLRREWGTHFVSARAEYGVFLPDELSAFVGVS